MEGVLLTWSLSPQYWYPFRLQLLDSDEPTEFRKSYICRPDGLEFYGDKDVSHRKMVGSVQPEFTESVWPWTYDSGSVDLGYNHRYPYNGHQYTRWAYRSGTDYCISFGLSWDAEYISGAMQRFISQPHVWEARIKEIDGHTYLQYREGHTLKDGEYPYYTVEEWAKFPFHPADWFKVSSNWVTVAEKINNSWRIDSYFSQSKVNFTIRHPLPYYWLDYMASIKPTINPSLLSEVIRTTITDETTLATNNFANLTEIVDLINDIRKGKIIELVEESRDYYRLVKRTVGDISGKNLRTLLMNSSKKISSGWLKYRYAYNTTKSDIEQYIRVKLGEKMGRLTEERVLRGHISDANYDLRIKMRLIDNPAANLDYVLIGLNQHGLMPSLYNVWDLIPYSFIADWGSNLGDYLQDIDESTLYWRYYKIKELLVSEKCVKDIKESWGLTTYTWYDRYFLTNFPQWEIYDDRNTSARVKIYRFLDAASLTVGSL